MKLIRKTLLGIVGGFTLITSVAMAQDISEKCELPKWFSNPTQNYISNPKLDTWNIFDTKYHVHIYDVSGNGVEDMIVFFELDSKSNPINHPENPKYYGFDFNESNDLEISELCEKKIENGKAEWYKVKKEDLLKPEKLKIKKKLS